MNFNIGDNVIITKRICNIKAVKGVVCHIGKSFYGVKHGRPNSSGTCNIFINHSSETIELDIQQQREDKINTILNDTTNTYPIDNNGRFTYIYGL